jgi:CheY-like chemotaxis protein
MGQQSSGLDPRLAHGALVLVVDDSAETCELYAEFLSAAFRVVTATSGLEALHKALHLRPSAVVIDLQLPDMRGEEAIRALRRDDRTRHTAVLVVSGFEEPQNAEPFWDAYFVKPCNLQVLMACIDQMISPM